MASDTTPNSPADRAGPQGLSMAIRAYLGLLLNTACPVSPRPPDRFAGLLEHLTSALAAQADRDADTFHAEFIGVIPNLRRFAISLTQDAVRADDLVQETMLKAWRSRAGYKPGTNLTAWLFTIMRNSFYSSCRKHHLETNSSDDDHASGLSALPDQLDRLDLQDMQAAFGRLAPSMRQALTLVAIDNLTYEEAAASMNCRIGTVKSRVWRAREQLAIILDYDAAELGADHVTMSAMNPPGIRTRI